MGGLIEMFVVVNPEGAEASGGDRDGAYAADLWSEEASGDAGHHHQRGEPVVIRDIRTDGVARDFRIVPLDGESNRGGAEDAEVVGVVRVLPDVLAVYHQIFSEGLLQAGVKLIAKARSKRSGCAGGATLALGCEQSADDWVQAPDAGKHQVLVERRFQGSRIGSAQNRVGLLDVVGNTEARLGLRGMREAFIDIPADTKVERPILPGDGILNVHRELFHIGMTRKKKLSAICLPNVAAVAGRQRSGSGQVNTTEEGNKRTDGPLAEVGHQRPGALRLRGDTWAGVRGSVGVEADGVQCGIHNSEGIVLGEERLFVHDSGLDIVNAFHDGKLGVSTSVGQRAVLIGGFLLKVRRAEVGEWIVAAVVVELVAADKPAEREHCRGVDQVRPGRSDVVGSDLGTLIRGPDGNAVGTKTAVINHHAEPRRGELPVKRIRRLEPGAGVKQVKVQGVCGTELIIYAVEDVFFVALVVHYGVLRTVEKPAAVQTVRGNEVSPLFTAIRQVEPGIGGAKRAVGRRDAAVRSRDTLAGARGGLDDQARLVSEFGRRGSGDNFQ